MSTAQLELFITGLEDKYLTDNPDFSLFKKVYKRYSNFAKEVKIVQFAGNINFGNTIVLKLSKIGDLLSRMTLQIDIPCVDPHGDKFAWVQYLGYSIIKYIKIEIGGKTIDMHNNILMFLMNQLQHKNGFSNAYNHMLGNIPKLINYNSKIKPAYTLLIPLSFWFNKYLGLSLPIAALSKSVINITIELEELHKLIIRSNCFDPCNIELCQVQMLIDCFYLTDDENNKILNGMNEYVIEQIQTTGPYQVMSSTPIYVLPFSHPVKELFWCIQNGLYNCGKRFLYYPSDFSKINPWNPKYAAREIVARSIKIGYNPTGDCGGDWLFVDTNGILRFNGWNIINKSQESIFVNPTSVSGITNKISVDIIVMENCDIVIENLQTTINICDLSKPIEYFCDTRYKPDIPIVYISTNFGIFIDGTENPMISASIKFNGQFAANQFDYLFYNQVQPFNSGYNSPVDGVYMYSFSLDPISYQPSGTVDFSTIDKATLNMIINKIYDCDENNKLFIFAVNYNLFKINGGYGVTQF